jgi:hypothetical protein
VTLAMLANLAANSIILNNTGSPATPIAGTPAQALALIGAVPVVQPVVPYAVASRTLIAADIGALDTDTYATAVTVSLPQDSDCTAIAIGHSGEGLVLGAGTVTIAAGSGATLIKVGTAVNCAPSGSWYWRKVAANTYKIGGELS